MTESSFQSNTTNIFCLDVEEWHHLNFASMNSLPSFSLEQRVKNNTEILLDAMSEYKSQGTFFFLGSVAEQYPELVRRVQAEGHEIASHGYGHKLVYQQTRTEFYEDVQRSLEILQDITGVAVKGYRAPSWSINQNILWAYEVLVELGLLYDSSLFPFTTFLYGDSQAPIAPFVRMVNGSKLYEVPATVLELFGQRLPFAGGFYFRFLPYWAMRLATDLVNRRGRSVIFYLHPREIDPGQPRLPLPLKDYYISYANLSGTLKKLKRMLSLSPTISIYHHLKLSGLMDNDGYDPSMKLLASSASK